MLFNESTVRWHSLLTLFPVELLSLALDVIKPHSATLASVDVLRFGLILFTDFTEIKEI